MGSDVDGLAPPSRLTEPLSWPGRLTSSGTGVISSMLPRFTSRRSNCPFLNDTPWSATPRSARRRRGPARRGARASCRSCRSANPVCSRWRSWSCSHLALVLVALARDLGNRLGAVAPVLAAVGQVLPRHVRQQRVLEVQRRALLAGIVADPLVEAALAVAGEVRARVGLVAGVGGRGRRRRPRRRRRTRPRTPTPSAGPPRSRAARPRGRRPGPGPRSSTSAGPRTARRGARPRTGRAGRRWWPPPTRSSCGSSPSRVKRLLGCSEAVGSRFSISGRLPSRMAGTARLVES